MIIIAHRGITDRQNTAAENHPDQIHYALQLGLYAECDAWYDGNKFALGHDRPQYEVDSDFFLNSRLFIHCKSISALYKLKDNPIADVFFHDQDLCTLTKNGLIWTHFKYEGLLTNQSIAVLPELSNKWNILKCYGICTDNYLKYKMDLKNV